MKGNPTTGRRRLQYMIRQMDDGYAALKRAAEERKDGDEVE